LLQSVRHVGLDSAKPFAGFDLLAQDPHKSVDLLVFELRPIPRGRYAVGKKTPQELHMLGCFRALRYLTGVSFSARTSARLSDDESQFLDFDKQMHDSNPSHKLHFFGVWMSRDTDFVAPVDAQKAIIKEWRRFQVKEGAGFTYKQPRPAAECMDDWFWFG